MLIASQGGASGVLYGHVRGAHGFVNPMENAVAGESAANAASRGEFAAQTRRVIAPDSGAAMQSANDNDNPGYSASGSGVGARSLRITTASPLSVFEAAVAREVNAAPPTDLQQLISTHLETASKPPQNQAADALQSSDLAQQAAQPAAQQQQPAVGPDRGEVGGSGPREFNKSLSGDGVASPEEVWAKSSWAKAHPFTKDQPDLGAAPIGYDGGGLATPAVADKYAAAQRAAFA